MVDHHFSPPFGAYFCFFLRATFISKSKHCLPGILRMVQFSCRVLKRGGCSRGGGNWGTLRISREDWGTLENMRED